MWWVRPIIVRDKLTFCDQSLVAVLVPVVEKVCLQDESLERKIFQFVKSWFHGRAEKTDKQTIAVVDPGFPVGNTNSKGCQLIIRSNSPEN